MAITSALRKRNRPVREKMPFYGVWAFESHHDDSFRMGPTTHRFPKLLLIREGAGAIKYDSRQDDCKAGDLIVVNAGERHWLVDQAGSPMSLLGLGVSTKLLATIPQVADAWMCGVFSPDQTASLSVEQRMRRLLYLDGQEDPARQLACVGGAIELFAEVLMMICDTHKQNRLEIANGAKATPAHPLVRQTPEVDIVVHPLVQSYLLWLRDHFYEDLDIDHAARACNMSRRHFTTCFRQATGTSWLDYLHQLRVRYAIELLQLTDRKITSIAFASGFRDLTTFYRVMTKVTKKRPADFRVS